MTNNKYIIILEAIARGYVTDRAIAAQTRVGVARTQIRLLDLENSDGVERANIKRYVRRGDNGAWSLTSAGREMVELGVAFSMTHRPKVKPTTRMMRVVNLLKESGKAMTTREISSALDMMDHRVYVHLHNACQHGLVVDVAPCNTRGMWVYNPNAPEIHVEPEVRKRAPYVPKPKKPKPTPLPKPEPKPKQTKHVPADHTVIRRLGDIPLSKTDREWFASLTAPLSDVDHDRAVTLLNVHNAKLMEKRRAKIAKYLELPTGNSGKDSP